MQSFKRAPRRRAQRGVVAVEFGLLALIFFGVVFGTMEVARAMYLWSTMVESTQRAARVAANSRFDSVTLAKIRADAMSDRTGGMFMTGDLNATNIKIDYLDSTLTPVSPMPSCPGEHILNCSADVNGRSCIRFVRARLCTTASSASSADICTVVPYVPIIGGGFFPTGGMKIPTFSTITPAGLLGHVPGASSCP